MKTVAMVMRERHTRPCLKCQRGLARHNSGSALKDILKMAWCSVPSISRTKLILKYLDTTTVTAEQ